jgi:Cu-Zn family superoxide dismutase
MAVESMKGTTWTELAMRTNAALLLAAGLGLAAWPACGQQEQRTKVMMNLVDSSGPKAAIGTVMFSDSAKGLVIEPNLTGLPPGEHGFHVHENPDCGNTAKDGKKGPAVAAGDHYDPERTGTHRGPHVPRGHLGDLPVLVVRSDGSSTDKLLAPRLKVADLRGRSLLIHAGGDNFADQPAPSGGGAERIACGVFELKMAR